MTLVSVLLIPSAHSPVATRSRQSAMCHDLRDRCWTTGDLAAWSTLDIAFMELGVVRERAVLNRSSRDHQLPAGDATARLAQRWPRAGPDLTPRGWVHLRRHPAWSACGDDRLEWPERALRTSSLLRRRRTNWWCSFPEFS